jgi:uncharacterized Zn finger protein
MCKHVAAVMYGVGARLDHQPELLFALRKIDHAEIITQAADLVVTRPGSRRKTIADDALGSVFGIDLDEPPAARRKPATQSRGAEIKPSAALKRKR